MVGTKETRLWLKPRPWLQRELAWGNDGSRDMRDEERVVEGEKFRKGAKAKNR